MSLNSSSSNQTKERRHSVFFPTSVVKIMLEFGFWWKSWISSSVQELVYQCKLTFFTNILVLVLALVFPPSWSDLGFFSPFFLLLLCKSLVFLPPQSVSNLLRQLKEQVSVEISIWKQSRSLHSLNWLICSNHIIDPFQPLASSIKHVFMQDRRGSRTWDCLALWPSFSN